MDRSEHWFSKKKVGSELWIEIGWNFYSIYITKINWFVEYDSCSPISGHTLERKRGKLQAQSLL